MHNIQELENITFTCSFGNFAYLKMSFDLVMPLVLFRDA